MSLRNRVKELRMVQASQLIPNEKNYRLHPASQRRAYDALVAEIGFAGATLVYETADGLKLIDGHMRVDAHGDEAIPVLITDLNAAEASALLRMFDPLGAMAETAHDELSRLNIEVMETFPNLSEALAASADAIGAEMSENEPVIPDAPEAQTDRAEELNKIWQVQSGDLFEIPSLTGDGVHRLLCGDSTNAEDVSRLMDGDVADTTFADPPYGMNLDTDFSGMQSKLFKGKTGGNYHDKIVGDDKPFDPNIVCGLLAPNEVFLWGADYYAERLPNKNNGSWFVWDKRLSEDADKMWGSGFELCWSKNPHKRDLVRIKWAGIFGMETQDTDKRVHANQKPVELAIWFLSRHSENIVYDPFGGSGTTMVACEQLSRQCRMIEIEPKYCAVILERMSNMGCEPIKVEQEKSPT